MFKSAADIELAKNRVRRLIWFVSGNMVDTRVHSGNDVADRTTVSRYVQRITRLFERLLKKNISESFYERNNVCRGKFLKC